MESPRGETSYSFIPVISFTRQVDESTNSSIENEVNIKIFNSKLRALLDLLSIIEQNNIKFELSSDIPGLVIKQEINEEVKEIIQDSLSEIFMEHIIVLSKK